MASSAFREFRYNVLDAKRLHQVHRIVSKGKPGRKGLGHLTRSGVVMLCAAWERYHESVIVEAVTYFTSTIEQPETLPLSVRKHLSKFAKEHIHDLKPMELAGDGWKQLLVWLAADEAGKLNTPKSTNLRLLYERFLGLNDVTDFWPEGGEPIDVFVKERGDIAHNGRQSPYIPNAVLSNYIQMVEDVVAAHDNRLCDFLKHASKATCQPWRRTAE
jgi:hypothetical protein